MSNKAVFPLVLSSPSGGGKTTIKNCLLKNPIFEFSITCTTREKREGEIDGVDYYFLTDDEFDEKIKKGEFLEWAQVHGRRYGTLKRVVDDILQRNKIPVMTIDVVGAMNVKKVFSDALLIFILPPNLKIMIERLKKRGENEKDILRRMKTAARELDYAQWFDYLVVNEEITTTVDRIVNIVNSYAERVSFKKALLADFRRDLNSYLEQNKEEV